MNATMPIADLVDEWPIVLIAAVVVVLAMVLAYRLMNRNPDVSRTRYGFFVERDRYTEEPGWPELRPPERRELPTWHDKTAEIPPKDDPASR